jgi:hypothetical protein
MQGAPDANPLVGYGAIFTLFFITLGQLQVALAVELMLGTLHEPGVIRG